MKLASLFDGIGGFPLAAMMLGIEPVWASEIEKFPMEVTKIRFPKMKHYGDVTKIKGSKVEPVDIITFGSPCFPAGTLVTTKRGYIPIECVVVGDIVLTHERRWKKVIKVGGKMADTILLEGKCHPGLECTREHPIYALSYFGEGGMPQWIEAEKMLGKKWGVLVSNEDKINEIIWDTVYSIRLGNENIPVYNLEVEDDNSYVVENIIVHNCQDLSLAGKRAGLDGQRSGLFMEAIRIIREMREATDGKYPRYGIWENVPGAFSSNNGEDFRVVLESFAQVTDSTVSIPRPPKGKWETAGLVEGNGYSIGYRLLNAQYWGVPQRRRRIFIISDFGGNSASEIFFESEGLSWYSKAGRNQGKGFAGNPTASIDSSVFCIQGNTIDRSLGAGANGTGVNVNVSYTLNTMDRHAVYSNEGVGSGVMSSVEVMAFDTNQITSPENGSQPNYGKPCHTLTSFGQPPTVSIKETQTVVCPTLTRYNLDSRSPQSAEQTAIVGAVLQAIESKESKTFIQNKCYSLDSVSSNSMKSSNPNSGFHETDISKCIDTTNPCPSKNQGGLAICTTYIEKDKDIVMINGQGSKGNCVTDVGITMFSLNAMHGYDMHCIIKPNKEDNAICFSGSGFSEFKEGQVASTLRSSGAKQTDVDLIVKTEESFKAAGVVSKGNGECWVSPEQHMSLSCGGGQAGQGYPCVLINNEETRVYYEQNFGEYQEVNKAGTINVGKTTLNIILDNSQEQIIAFTQNQREEVRDLKGIASTLSAEPGSHQQTYVATIDCRNSCLNEEISGTLQAKATGGYSLNYVNPVIIQREESKPTCFNVTFCDANGVRQDRPNGGLYVNETEVSNTLSTTQVNTLCVHATQTPITAEEHAHALGASSSQAVFSKTGFSNYEEGNKTETLRASGGDCGGGSEALVVDNNQTILFEPRSQDGTPRIHDDVCPTLNTAQGGQRQPCVCVADNDKQSMTIASRQIAMSIGNEIAGPVLSTDYKDPQVVFEWHNQDSRVKGPIDTAGTLNTNADGKEGHLVQVMTNAEGSNGATLTSSNVGKQLNNQTPLVASQEAVGFDGYNSMTTGGVSSSLGTNCGLSTGRNGVITNTVRRLTPLECERLQGYPDYFTLIPGASDSGRYKALGNSVAIPCVFFILSCLIRDKD